MNFAALLFICHLIAGLVGAEQGFAVAGAAADCELVGGPGFQLGCPRTFPPRQTKDGAGMLPYTVERQHDPIIRANCPCKNRGLRL